MCNSCKNNTLNVTCRQGIIAMKFERQESSDAEVGAQCEHKELFLNDTNLWECKFCHITLPLNVITELLLGKKNK